MKANILFSYPRSGNTWVRYIFECITGFPSQGTLDNLENDPPIYMRRNGIPVNPENPPKLFKRHTIDQLSREDLGLSLIVIVRNYKECIVRHKAEVLKDASLLDWQFKCYLDPISVYHAHKLPKLLIYYEDLIQSPIETVRKLGSFVNAPSQNIDNFLNNYENHQAQSVKKYEGGSQSLGTSIHFHEKKLAPEVCHLWDEEIQSLIPRLYENYLSRFRSIKQEEKCEKILDASQL